MEQPFCTIRKSHARTFTTFIVFSKLNDPRLIVACFVSTWNSLRVQWRISFVYNVVAVNNHSVHWIIKQKRWNEIKRGQRERERERESQCNWKEIEFKEKKEAPLLKFLCKATGPITVRLLSQSECSHRFLLSIRFPKDSGQEQENLNEEGRQKAHVYKLWKKRLTEVERGNM